MACYLPKVNFTRLSAVFLYTLYCAILMLFLKIVAIVISLLYSMSSLFYATTLTVNAQSDLQTIKYRNLVIDLGNGLKTNARLTIPAMGDGPFPGVIIFPGSGGGSVLPP